MMSASLSASGFSGALQPFVKGLHGVIYGCWHSFTQRHEVRADEANLGREPDYPMRMMKEDAARRARLGDEERQAVGLGKGSCWKRFWSQSRNDVLGMELSTVAGIRCRSSPAHRCPVATGRGELGREPDYLIRTIKEYAAPPRLGR